MKLLVSIPKEEYGGESWSETNYSEIANSKLLPFLNRYNIDWCGGLYSHFKQRWGYDAVRSLVKDEAIVGYTYTSVGTGVGWNKKIYTYYKLKYNAASSQIRIYVIPHKVYLRLLPRMREIFR